MDGQECPAGDLPKSLLLSLDAQQIACYKALQEKSSYIAGMYIGTLRVMRQEDNPDKLPQAAHSIRELMEKLPGVLDVPMQATKETLKSKVRELEDEWKKVITNKGCNDNGEWTGEIGGALQKFLKKTEKFFEWIVEHHPRRRNEYTEALRAMDNSNISLPEPLEVLSVKRWEEMLDFFQKVAHHRSFPSSEEFTQRLNALEEFILERLVPRTFDNFKIIDEIIAEGERDV